jgi:hypothetical protein
VAFFTLVIVLVFFVGYLLLAAKTLLRSILFSRGDAVMWIVIGLSFLWCAVRWKDMNMDGYARRHLLKRKDRPR